MQQITDGMVFEGQFVGMSWCPPVRFQFRPLFSLGCFDHQLRNANSQSPAARLKNWAKTISPCLVDWDVEMKDMVTGELVKVQINEETVSQQPYPTLQCMLDHVMGVTEQAVKIVKN